MLENTPSASADELRAALSEFATGVTIVTTAQADGTPVGLTVNSFNAVSLTPPLVLWSLDKSSRTIDAFTANDCFAVHIWLLTKRHWPCALPVATKIVS